MNSGSIDNTPRFAFGRNWQRFLRVVDEERISQAALSLQQMLETDSLNGKSFLDIGCGSGLISLATLKLGAAHVHSFDYDQAIVLATEELRRRYFPNSLSWTVEKGDILDQGYLSRLGKYDVVYCWGVLFATGNMHQAMENLVPLVAPGGKLFIAVYNDQGGKSRRWRMVKRLYNKHFVWHILILSSFVPYFILDSLARDLLRCQNPMNRYQEYKRNRGMSIFHDMIDWLGGYPFEVAKPEEVFDFYRERGFCLEKLKTRIGGVGNNEFVFVKNHESSVGSSTQRNLLK